MDEKKRTGWDVLVAVLAWCMLAVGPIESMYTYLAGAEGLGVPGWAISGMGLLLHLLRIGVPLLMNPAKSHNVGALVLAVLGLISALLPYIVAALKGLEIPVPPAVPADVLAPVGLGLLTHPVAAVSTSLPLLLLGLAVPGASGILWREQRRGAIRRRLRDGLLWVLGGSSVALAVLCVALLALSGCVKLPAQVRTDAVKVAALYDSYVVAATPPASAEDPVRWRADRLRLSAQFREVTGSTWASWSWRDVAVTITCYVERAAARDPEVLPAALAAIKETTRGIRVQTKLPADCPAVGGGVL